MLHHSSIEHSLTLQGRAVMHEDSSAPQPNIAHQSGAKQGDDEHLRFLFRACGLEFTILHHYYAIVASYPGSSFAPGSSLAEEEPG